MVHSHISNLFRLASACTELVERSKPSPVAWRRPFDKLRANGLGLGAKGMGMYASQNSPFGLSLSKPSPAPLREPLIKLGENGRSLLNGFEMVNENPVGQMA
jgi:hypothetical protein